MGWFGRRRPPDAADASVAPLTPPLPQPLAQADAATARQAHQHNPYSTWAARAPQANATDRSLACHRIWADQPLLGIRPKFRIQPGESIFAMGSCFAREVEDALVAQGLEVPSHCDALFSDPLLASSPTAPAPLRPRSYLNRYHSMALRDEVRHLLGLAPELEAGLLTYALDRGCSADLHYSQSLPQVNAERTLARRSRVREQLGPQLRRAGVIVLTLGLAECWFDAAAGRYLNNTPGPRVLAAFGEQLSVHQTRFAQHLQALEELHDSLYQARGQDFKIIITVSPVPLERSFLEQDVIIANTYAKAMLRTVAQEFAAQHPNVDYFPSYELVQYARPDRAWAWDHRHVMPELVAHVMALFQHHYLASGSTPAS